MALINQNGDPAWLTSKNNQPVSTPAQIAQNAAMAAAWQKQYPVGSGDFIPTNFEPGLQATSNAGLHPDGNILPNGQPEMTGAFGGTETQAQWQAAKDATSNLMTNYGNYTNAKNNGGLLGQLALYMNLGAVSAGAASFLAPAVGAAVGGGMAGGIAGGAAAGAATGAIGSGLTGQNIGKGALIGGLTGALGGAAKPFVSGLSSATGLNPTVSSALVKGGIGAAGSALTGGNPLVGGVVGAAKGLTPAVSSGMQSSTGIPNWASNIAVGAGASLGANALAGALTSNNSGQGNSMANISPLINGTGGPATMTAGGVNGTGPQYDFSSTGSTLGSLLGPALTTAAGVYGSQNAAEAQTAGINAGIGTQQQTQANVNSLYGPQSTLGNEAFGTLGSTLGLNGQPANYSNFYNMPGYQFAVQQGTQAINRSAAATGNAYTPQTQANIGQYVTGTAAQDYNTYVGQLMSTAGFGAQANSTLTGANLNTGANTSQLQQNAGSAQASGVAGSAGAISSLLGKLPWGSIGSAAGNTLSGSVTGSGPGSLNTPVTSGNLGSVTGGVNSTGVDNSGVFDNMATPTSGYLSDAQLGGGGNPIPLDNSGNLDWLNYNGG